MTLFKRPDSTIFWFKFNHKGKHHRHSTDIEDDGTKKARKEALKIANGHYIDLIRSHHGVAEAQPAPMLKDAIEEWFKLYVQVEHSDSPQTQRSEEHTSELQSRLHLVCRLLLEKKKKKKKT